MPVLKNFNLFSDNIENLIKEVQNPRFNFLRFNAIASGNQSLTFGGGPAGSSDPLDIRDPEDGVTYFMIGMDRVGSPSKTSR
jgi:hypothetical protein